MRARLLKKLLNNTGYNISNHDEYIAIGSSLCHDLYSVNKDTLKVKYALDTFREGRNLFVKKGEDDMLFIWDKLHELIETGEIHDIINGSDDIENPLPVFTVKNGKLKFTVTDAYGWPNTDHEGNCMYDNTHFPTSKEAIEYGIKDYTYGLECSQKNLQEAEEKVTKIKGWISEYEGFISHLKSLLTPPMVEQTK